MCLATPSMPAPQAMPTQPTEQDTMPAQQYAKQKRARQAMSGYQGTVLSGPVGDISSAPGKSVLGG